MLFGFGRNRKEGDEEEREQKRQAQLDALARGELLPDAVERLRQGVLTSDLSSNEFLVAQERGCRSLGVVMGSAFYSVRFGGMYGLTWRGSTQELADLSKALLAARQLAVKRLRLEAAALGAHGVIGVRLQFKRHDWSTNHIEFTAIGTAVHIDGMAAPNEPFTSSLSAQEFWQLYQADFLPKELVMGVCAYYVSCDSGTAQIINGTWGSGWKNVEVSAYSDGLIRARKLATERLYQDIRRTGAAGAVGMEIDYDFEEREYEQNNVKYVDLVISFVALGTAIVPRGVGKITTSVAPLIVFDLASGESAPLAPVGSE